MDSKVELLGAREWTVALELQRYMQHDCLPLALLPLATCALRDCHSQHVHMRACAHIEQRDPLVAVDMLITNGGTACFTCEVLFFSAVKAAHVGRRQHEGKEHSCRLQHCCSRANTPLTCFASLLPVRASRLPAKNTWRQMAWHRQSDGTSRSPKP
eukprot:257138-Chlamydomonas_euryale.AAC.3